MTQHKKRKASVAVAVSVFGLNGMSLTGAMTFLTIRTSSGAGVNEICLTRTLIFPYDARERLGTRRRLQRRYAKKVATEVCEEGCDEDMRRRAGEIVVLTKKDAC